MRLGDFILHISFGSFQSSIYKDLVSLFHNEVKKIAQGQIPFKCQRWLLSLIYVFPETLPLSSYIKKFPIIYTFIIWLERAEQRLYLFNKWQKVKSIVNTS